MGLDKAPTWVYAVWVKSQEVVMFKFKTFFALLIAVLAGCASSVPRPNLDVSSVNQGECEKPNEWVVKEKDGKNVLVCAAPRAVAVPGGYSSFYFRSGPAGFGGFCRGYYVNGWGPYC